LRPGAGSARPIALLDLHTERAIAILRPLSLDEPDDERDAELDLEPIPVYVLLRGWIRVLLVVLALLACGVFAIAIYLHPYAADGTPLTQETHRQLGLPPCTFKFATGLPCPSCGMTTSFALLIRGDVLNSLRANAAGTLLAVLTLAFIPWGLASAYKGRLLFIVSFEKLITRVVVLFLVVMLVRWGIVLLLFHTG
jgi:hypothetical protein